MEIYITHPLARWADEVWLGLVGRLELRPKVYPNTNNKLLKIIYLNNNIMNQNIKLIIYFLLGVILYYLLFNDKLVEGIIFQQPQQPQQPGQPQQPQQPSVMCNNYNCEAGTQLKPASNTTQQGNSLQENCCESVCASGTGISPIYTIENSTATTVSGHGEIKCASGYKGNAEVNCINNVFSYTGCTSDNTPKTCETHGNCSGVYFYSLNKNAHCNICDQSQCCVFDYSWLIALVVCFIAIVVVIIIVNHYYKPKEIIST
jgi:hypothetical protein